MYVIRKYGLQRIILIISLLIFNFLLIYSKINSTNIRNINIKLNNNEVGIVFISLDNSKSLLLKKDNINILYILDYNDDSNLLNTVYLFTNSIDYVILDKDWDVYIDNTLVLNNPINISNIKISHNKIIYNKHVLCINESNSCSYSYYYKSPVTITERQDILFYEDNLVIDSLNDEWLDKYKISNTYYTFMVLNDGYEVSTIVK